MIEKDFNVHPLYFRFSWYKSPFCRDDKSEHCGSGKVVFILPIRDRSHPWRTVHVSHTKEYIAFPIPKGSDDLLPMILEEIGPPEAIRGEFLQGGFPVFLHSAILHDTNFADTVSIPIDQETEVPGSRRISKEIPAGTPQESRWLDQFRSFLVPLFIRDLNGQALHPFLPRNDFPYPSPVDVVIPPIGPQDLFLIIHQVDADFFFLFSPPLTTV